MTPTSSVDTSLNNESCCVSSITGFSIVGSCSSRAFKIVAARCSNPLGSPAILPHGFRSSCLPDLPSFYAGRQLHRLFLPLLHECSANAVILRPIWSVRDNGSKKGLRFDFFMDIFNDGLSKCHPIIGGCSTP